MTRPATTRDLWLVLGARNAADFEQRSLTRIRALLPNTDKAPIRLAPAAKQLDINPIPTYEGPTHSFRHGRLEYDPDRGRFQIFLCRETARTKRPHVWGHERYSYAHELAHRLFYVQEQDGFTRACVRATEDFPASSQFRVRTAMEVAEERMCNRLTSRLLVPDGLLDQEDLRIDGTIAGLTGLLARLANRYEVSRECIFLRLRDRITARALAAPPEFCALLITYSNQEGSQGGAAWQYRVRLAIAPQWHAKKPLYPGVPVGKLGAAFAHEIQRIVDVQSEERGVLTAPTPGGLFVGTWQRSGQSRDAVICIVGALTSTDAMT